ncbi:hypothetical protein [Vaginisenegalia massiliensis]|uniref:hypothetical protein n=1 Tax=Vaginisenegalia massiliensis TaxID=2058294 RepID=UPI000F52108A|nr:hypothetical protein [Vaginisenegalia massiliensis]
MYYVVAWLTLLSACFSLAFSISLFFSIKGIGKPNITFTCIRSLTLLILAMLPLVVISTRLLNLIGISLVIVHGLDAFISMANHKMKSSWTPALAAVIQFAAMIVFWIFGKVN